MDAWSESLERGLVDLLADAVDGGASVGFLSDISPAEGAEFWRAVRDTPGATLLVLESNEAIVGSVVLARCTKANGRHRAEIQKLLVHRDHRGQGLSRRLMDAAEGLARREGLRLLHLDTLEGSAAASIYPRLGWTRSGIIPEFAATPDGAIHPTVIFYKRLVEA